MFLVLEVVLSLLTLAALFYWHVTKKYGHWRALGVPQVEPSFPFGTWGDVILRRQPGKYLWRKQYQQFRGTPYYGTYVLHKPVLMIRDPEYVKMVLIKDFDHFVDRAPGIGRLAFGINLKNKVDLVWAKQVGSLTGDEWKSVRSTITPMFTSSRLKAMTGLIYNVVSELSDFIQEKASSDKMFDTRDPMSRFSMDTIASCGFGVDARSFKDESPIFADMAMNLFKKEPIDQLKFFISLLPLKVSRKILELFDMPFAKPVPTNFFIKVFEDTVKLRREDESTRRNDMVDLMLDFMKENESDEESETNNNIYKNEQFEKDTEIGNSSKCKLDDILIMATALIYLVAGFHTTARTLAYCIYRLAINQDIQKKLRDEIDEAFENAGGEVPEFETIMNLPYMDMVLNETLRVHPALDIISRKCVKDYKLSNSNITIKKGETIHVNVIGIHYDEDYFPDPDRFNPENFAKENRAKRSPYTSLGFGQGPRACIGMRFAMFEAKLCLATLVRKFEFLRCEKTSENLTWDPTSPFGDSKEGLWVKANQRI